ncbi:MAG TPA: alpha/beta fold hydrolase [Thermoleophilaceae bacterium]|nr:alpha/beta fold hydrolase [Thermoleophilaceae bacterium]
MEVRLLGPVDARVGDASLKLGGAKQRALLARMALDPGRTVPAERLVDDIWGERGPESAAKMVQVYVSQLRKVLPADVLVTRAPGYTLDIAPDDVDAHRFSRLRVDGSAALAADDPAAARSLLGEALSLWHGEALADLSEPFADLARAHFEELRLTCLEDRIDADLGLGGHSGVIGELDELARRNPLRERLVSQLMLALYRSGRQAEALAAYQAFRRSLADELGIDPSPRLRELEGQILRQDPTLAPRASPSGDGRAAHAHAGPAAPSISRPEPDWQPLPRGEVRYARNGDVSIAYQVVGSGDLDLVFVPGFVSHMEMFWEDPATARFFRRLASFSRLILHDKREQGLSDRLGRPPTLEESMDDVRAVMDAAGSERAALFGISEGGPSTLLFAATHPQRTAALVVYGTYARMVATDDFPAGLPADVLESWQAEILSDWGNALKLELFAPSLVDDVAFGAWWSRLLRTGTSPRGAAGLFKLHASTDVRHLLSSISAPTLVLHRTDDPLCTVEGGREVAGGIPGARLIEQPGSDHLWMAGDQDLLLDEVEEFLTGSRQDREPERVLQTVLFTDIVDSTRRAGELGDRRWRDLLAAYESRVGRQIERFRGRLVKSLGDGTFATFDGPARGINCARAIRDDIEALGLELRAGLHTGECEVVGDDLAGVAVHIGARVSATAAPGEVLVSGTVRDLVAGSDIRFEERPPQELKGLPGEWRLYAIAG